MAGFPEFYDPGRIGTLFYPDKMAIAKAAEGADLPPAETDERNVHMVVIDMQVDFCHERGSLYIPGALDDIRRTIEFIYRNAERITHITCSLDSHVPSQIFAPVWWVDADGNHPDPFTIITADDVRAGTWRPVREPDYSARYVEELERKSKKQLLIWPYHVQIGSVGHTLDAELWSAVFWHAVGRRTQPLLLTKGSVARTEHYSVIEPEVPAPDQPGGGKNEAFLDILARSDRIVIAGEAESHCVLETLEDLVDEFGDQPDVLAKVLVLRDCTSPVAHPEIDFHAIAQERFAEFEKAGVQFANSTDPLP